MPNRRRRRSPGGPPDDDDSDGGQGGGGGGGGAGGSNPGNGRNPGGGGPGGPGGGGGGPPNGNHAASGPNSKLSQTNHSGPIHGGRNPLNPGFNPSDLFGNALKRDGIILFNTSWRVGEGNERLCYKRKELDAKLKLPRW